MKGIFRKYYRRMVRIGILKSILVALIPGFCVNFLVAFITLFFDMSVAAVLCLSVGAGVAAFALSAPMLYRWKFKPTIKSMAAELDGQGLEERTVTMIEFEDDDSFIAGLQRKNAAEKLNRVNPKSIKLVLPSLLVVVLAVSVALAVSMTTVTTLSSADVIDFNRNEEDPGEQDVPPSEEPGEDIVSVLYEAGEHGRVDGELFQEFPKGGDATAVVAIPDEGYEFVFWSDGVFTAERRDTDVMVSFSARAIFAKQVQAAPGEGNGGGEQPGGDGQGQQGGNQQGGAGEGNNGGEGGDGQGQDGEGQGGGGAGGSGAGDNNTVIDGNSDYHKEIDYEAAKDAITKDDTLSQEEKDMLLAYLETLMEGQ